MIKFSITKLESARKNPLSFARSLKQGLSSGNFTYSKYMSWQNAVFNYHKSQDERHAIHYLINALLKFKSIQRDKRELQEYIQKLQLYISDHHSMGNYFVESRKRILIDAHPHVKITGQVPIINMNPNLGYRIYFFSKEVFNWENELRFPLIQYYFAEHVFGCELSELEVGIYCFETSAHYQKSYSKMNVTDALEETLKIGEALNK